MKTLHTRIGSGRLSFGKPELLAALFGLTPGAVTPFGAINDAGRRVTIILDQALMRHEMLNFHPLDNTATTTIAGRDLLRFLRHTGHEPRILPVSGAEPASAVLERPAESAT
jgi:Ala-tRNA(Pro) deacylase